MQKLSTDQMCHILESMSIDFENIQSERANLKAKIARNINNMQDDKDNFDSLSDKEKIEALKNMVFVLMSNYLR